jgi:hypothetical protein
VFFANLGLGEFLALLAGASGVLVALYLLDRSRKKRRVATLRFWNPGESGEQPRKRRRIQQPWSLLLQILSVLLLLLAIAQLRWGTRETATRDHVLLLDTSAWMAARSSRGALIDEARAAAIAWLRTLPAADRVMVVRADVLATPATSFETSRALVESAIRDSQPGAGALRLSEALAFAVQAQKLHGRGAGEIAFAGAGRVPADDATLPAPPNLRWLPVSATPANAGLRRIGARRSATEPEIWELLVTVRNGLRTPLSAPLEVRFGDAPLALRRVNLAPGAEQEEPVRIRTRAAGLLDIRLLVEDDFLGDNQAVLELPADPLLQVTVVTTEPGTWQPLLTSESRIQARYVAPAAYQPAPEEQLVILDRAAPLRPPSAPTLWIEPPASASPVPVQSSVSNAALTRWDEDHPLALNLRSADLRLERTEVFRPAPGDRVAAFVAEGPVILGREKPSRSVVLGFHPFRSGLRFELAAPLVFANAVRWLAPDALRRRELVAGSPGLVRVPLEKEVTSVRVLGDDQRPLPFTRDAEGLRFFAGEPGMARVLAGGRELVYALTLPEIPEEIWKVPAKVPRGVPAGTGSGAPWRELWPWLAALGGAGLLAEWLFFGRARREWPALARQPLPRLWRRAS